MSSTSMFHLDDLPIGVCIVDTDLKITLINSWLSKLASPQECVGLPSTDALPILGQDLESALREVIVSGEPECNKLVQVKAHEDLITRTLRRSIQQVRDDKFEVIGARCVVEDVSEVAEVLLVLNTVLDKRRMGITVWSHDLELTLANEMAADMLEFPEGWLVPGRLFEDGLKLLAERGEYGEGDVQELVRTRMELARRFEPHAFERVTADGRTLEIHGAPIPSGGFVSTHLDISEQKQRLRHSEDKYRTYVENSPNGIFIIDASARIADANGRACQMSGYSFQELMGMSLAELTNESPATADPFAEATRTGALRRELQFRRKSGENFDVLLNVVPISEEQLMATCTDISEQVRLQREKARLEERYQQSQKMEAIGRLAGGVAHDFNNMLCAITANAELGLLANETNDRVHASFQRIKNAAEHATSLTDQLLAFSRRQTISPRVVDLNEQLTKIAPILERLVGAETRLHITPYAGRATIMIAPGQLEQVVVNLAINARDAIAEGNESGELRISIFPADESLVPRRLCLAVQDTGCGMSVQVREKIFEPFFTTKGAGKGTGLGLATVFGIVQQHGGAIDVKSVLGEGTTVEVSFPLVDRDADAEVVSPEELRFGAGETILVVEDNTMVRSSTVQMLEHLGYQILEAASGHEALALSEQHKGEVHLLLTDVVMPLMNGREVAERIVKERPSTRVLFVSGYTDNILGSIESLGDVVELLHKPFSLATLSRRIHAVMTR